MSWKFLSYPLNDKAFGYGNGKRFELKQVRSMCCGDTSNNTEFSMPTHYGTHIDFPFHFGDNGKKSTDYDPHDFIFNTIGIVEVEKEVDDYLIKIEHLNFENLTSDLDFLIVKTGFCNRRLTDEYWEYGFGFHPETADYIKKKFPKIRAIGFDLISLNSFQNRPMGRLAHQSFLLKNDILIVEEMDLREVNANVNINQLIVSPLMLDNADGAPCTIFAKIN